MESAKLVALNEFGLEPSDSNPNFETCGELVPDVLALRAQLRVDAR